MNEANFEVQVENINNVDPTLEKLDYVITSDAIIMNRCKSWINLNDKIIESNIYEYPYIDFTKIGKQPKLSGG